MAGLNGNSVEGLNGSNGVDALNGSGHAAPSPDTTKYLVRVLPTTPAGSWPEVELNELEVERPRLEAEIAAAKARTAEARHRAAQRDADMRAALRAEITGSQEALAEMERVHEIVVAEVRAKAQAEVDRILSEARQQISGREPTMIGPETAAVTHAE